MPLLETNLFRFGQVEAVGVDQTLFWREGKGRTKQWLQVGGES